LDRRLQERQTLVSKDEIGNSLLLLSTHTVHHLPISTRPLTILDTPSLRLSYFGTLDPVLVNILVPAIPECKHLSMSS
jgi:hypothetical protein